ncbi:MAG: T9SS type A sorting domain-containing protein [Melioribacteraceae bacterium]|nr:T9SS type A sorting domain-containing protein [Melioribacteraceae bacterium]
MKREIKVTIILLLNLLFLNAQEGWYYQTPNNIRDVAFVTENKIVAVGQGIWISTDIEKNWEGIYPGYDQAMDMLGTNKWLEAVDFPSTSIGYAVGNGPKTVILKTTTGGSSWKELNPSSPWQASELHDVKFIDINTGFAVGGTFLNGNWKGTILKTTNGGSDWTVAHESSIFFQSIDITPNNTIWACGGTHYLAKSTDLGNTWTESNANSGSETYGISYKIKFIDDDRGLLHIGNANKLFRTTNGGSNWELLETGLDGNSVNIEYFSDGTVYTVLQNGLAHSGFYKSTNHGTTWTTVKYVEDIYFNLKFLFKDKNFGFFNINSANKFITTKDGGLTYNDFNISTDFLYFKENTLYGWASSYGKHLLRTTNGKTWNIIESSTTTGKEIYSIKGMQFFDENNGFAIGVIKLSDVSTQQVLMGTNDGGITWEVKELPYGPVAIHFVDETYGWVVGALGMIYKTLDGGATWGPQTSGTSEMLLDVFFYDEMLGWAVGEGNTLLKTENGGLLWNKIDLPNFTNYANISISSYSGEICYMVGTDGIYKSADAGDTWISLNKPANTTGYYNQKIIMVSDTELYLLFYDTFYHSNDGGGTWKLVKKDAHYIYPQTHENIWATYAGGIIYTSNSGVVSVEDESKQTNIVSDFKLFQNYPNPFNPTTSIEYSVPSNENVTLKVFDILGREVATLVNQQMNPGNYKVQFDASQLVSGVYFYRISAGNYNKTMKMLLLK